MHPPSKRAAAGGGGGGGGRKVIPSFPIPVWGLVAEYATAGAYLSLLQTNREIYESLKAKEDALRAKVIAEQQEGGLPYSLEDVDVVPSVKSGVNPVVAYERALEKLGQVAASLRNAAATVKWTRTQEYDDDPSDYWSDYYLEACLLGEAHDKLVQSYRRDRIWFRNYGREDGGSSWQIFPTPYGDDLARVYGGSFTRLSATSLLSFGDGYRSRLGLLRMQTVPRVRFQWEFPVAPGQDNVNRSHAGATLLMDRYLLIVGGVQVRGTPCLSPVLMDTHTWTWMDNIAYMDATGTRPGPRYGCSVHWDAPRRRLLLFGGGNNRLENDDAVWAWQPGNHGQLSAENVLESFPWQWTCLRRVSQEQTAEKASNLRSCLSINIPFKPHSMHHVARDMLVFVSPANLGLLVYDLSTDSFVHPSIFGKENAPAIRASFLSAFLPQKSAIWIRYNSRENGDTVTGMLELVPSTQVI